VHVTFTADLSKDYGEHAKRAAASLVLQQTRVHKNNSIQKLFANNDSNSLT